MGGKRDDQYGMRVMSKRGKYNVEAALRAYGVRCVTLDFAKEYHVSSLGTHAARHPVLLLA